METPFRDVFRYELQAKQTIHSVGLAYAKTNGMVPSKGTIPLVSHTMVHGAFYDILSTERKFTMSMPTFPEGGVSITKEQAFNMLLGSIAMEELALSHILNAEGEKLQYVLGTLPQAAKVHTNTEEILEVNQSITKILEHVAHNQYLLKGKLSQVLEAQEKWCPPPCPPPCPHPEPEPCPPPCPPSCPHPSCQTIFYHERCAGMWYAGHWLAWKGGGNAPGEPAYSTALIDPPAKGVCLIHFLFEVIPSSVGSIGIALSSVTNQSSTLLLESTAQAGAANVPVYLTGSTVLSPPRGEPSGSALAFSLCEPRQIWLKRAQVSLTPLW